MSEEFCEDAVSRKKVEMILKFYDVHNTCLTVDNIRKDLDNLPSVMPMCKKAKWLKREVNSYFWQCSNCGTVIYSEYIDDLNEFHHWCGKCGSEMGDNNE